MALKIKQQLPSPLAEAEVLALDGSKVKINSLYENRPALMVFIRHFGCIGCTTQMLAIAPRLHEIDKLGIGVKIIGNGKLSFLEGFIDRFKLEDKPVEVFTDPSLNAYKQAQLSRSAWKALGPKTWLDYLFAFSKGIGQSSIEGDNLQLGGTLLVKDIFYLRFLTVVAMFVFLPYYFLQGNDPLWEPILWTVVFTGVNVHQIIRLYLERRPVVISDEDQAIYEQSFTTFTLRQFAKLLKLSDKKFFKQKECILKEDVINSLTNLCLSNCY